MASYEVKSEGLFRKGVYQVRRGGHREDSWENNLGFLI